MAVLDLSCSLARVLGHAGGGGAKVLREGAHARPELRLLYGPEPGAELQARVRSLETKGCVIVRVGHA